VKGRVNDANVQGADLARDWATTAAAPVPVPPAHTGGDEYHVATLEGIIQFFGGFLG
jgi:hypothetical protein